MMPFNSQSQNIDGDLRSGSSERDRLYDSIDRAREKSKEKDEDEKKAGWFLVINNFSFLIYLLSLLYLLNQGYKFLDSVYNMVEFYNNRRFIL